MLLINNCVFVSYDYTIFKQVTGRIELFSN